MDTLGPWLAFSLNPKNLTRFLYHLTYILNYTIVDNFFVRFCCIFICDGIYIFFYMFCVEFWCQKQKIKKKMHTPKRTGERKKKVTKRTVWINDIERNGKCIQNAIRSRFFFLKHKMLSAFFFVLIFLFCIAIAFFFQLIYVYRNCDCVTFAIYKLLPSSRCCPNFCIDKRIQKNQWQS